MHRCAQLILDCLQINVFTSGWVTIRSTGRRSRHRATFFRCSRNETLTQQKSSTRSYWGRKRRPLSFTELSIFMVLPPFGHWSKFAIRGPFLLQRHTLASTRNHAPTPSKRSSAIGHSPRSQLLSTAVHWKSNCAPADATLCPHRNLSSDRMPRRRRSKTGRT